MNICKICNRSYIYSRKAGHGKSKCNSCVVNTRRENLKAKCVAYKGGICQHCGYGKCLQAMAFHHRDPKTKSFEISGSHCRSWKQIKKELDKCDLLCHNCHAELHSVVGRTVSQADL